MAEISSRATALVTARAASAPRHEIRTTDRNLRAVARPERAVLAVLDGRVDAMPALRLARDLAAARRHQLVVLRVFPLDLHSVSGPYDTEEEYRERDRIRRMLAALATEGGVPSRTETVFAFGSTRRMITQAAERHHADLVVRAEPRRLWQSLLRRPLRLVVEPFTPSA